MKTIFEAAIRKGSYDLDTMLGRIEAYHIQGRLSESERDALTAAARDAATMNVDAPGEIQRLWAAVTTLTQRVAALEGTQTPEDVIAPYVQPTGAHDAYYAGARVLYGGSVYQCIAPEGVACTWSPDVMPGYWQAS